MAISNNQIELIAKEVIEKEAIAVSKLRDYIDDSFISAVKFIYNSKGRLIVTGIGKSAIIGTKIVATLNSTGTYALFMHAAEAIHGDLGTIMPQDIVMCISKSGNTPEIKMVVPLIKRLGNPIIAMVSNCDSYLANNSDYIIRTTIESEACPNNLAPTSSTTTQLVMGDTLAISLLKLRGFSAADFAKLHPGGSLGKRLYITVGDLLNREDVPQVSLKESIENTILTISNGRLGATAVIDEHGILAGIITDGDVRRMLQKGASIDSLKAGDIMSPNPKTIEIDQLAYKAFSIMESNKITSVVVLEEGEYRGLIHIHDIIREGIV